MRTLLLIGFGVAVGWFLFSAPNAKSAMDKCQEKFSYSTCVHTLR